MCIATPKMPSVEVPDVPEPQPAPVDEQVIVEMQERRKKQRQMSGVAGTILTSGLEEEASTVKPTLLGR